MVTSPRVITQAGHEASIRTASKQVPVVNSTDQKIDATLRPAGIGPDLLWSWKEAGRARVERTIVLVLTFRPLLPTGN